MKINKLIRAADRHSREASRLRREFRVHGDRSVNIARRLLATPLGLSACFGIGAAVGVTTSRERDNHDDMPPRKRSRTNEVFADATTRLASALIVGVLMKASESPQETVPPETS